MLYDQSLLADHGQVSKAKQCCRATAGYESVIEEQSEVPTIPPKDLMKQTIEMYSKIVNDLIAQGYPRPMAETAAKKYMLGG